MARYIAQVLIVVEADSVGEAADAMSGALSETLKYDGHIVEWSYGREGDNYQFPRRLPAGLPDDLEDEDLGDLYASALPIVEIV